MKIINKLAIAFIFILSCFALGSGLLPSKNANAEAGNLPEYYSVKKEYNEGTEGNEDWKVHDTDPTFVDGQAICLTSTERIVVTLGKNTASETYTELITGLTYTININGTLYSGTQAESMADYGLEISVEGSTEEFKIIINPTKAREFSYGKYALNFSYTYYPDKINPQTVAFTSSMYILNEEDYVNYFNLENLKETNDGLVVDRTKKELPHISYKYKNFNLEITRSYQGLVTKTKLTFNNGLKLESTDENGNATQNHNIVANAFGEENKVYVTFSRLGVYYLAFTPINIGDSTDVIENFYNENISSTLSKTVHIFGIEANYTDQQGLLPFKMASGDKIDDIFTSAPWVIENTNYSADVTSYVSSDASDLLSIDAQNIAKTNQAPIYFESNVTLLVEDDDYTSNYYFFKDNSDFKYCTNLNELTITEGGKTRILATKTINYDGSPLSKTGIYLVEFAYKYGTDNTEIKQYFLFKLTNDAPNTKIYSVDKDDPNTTTNINNNQYTCNNVFVSKDKSNIFDSKSTLTVSKDNSFNGNFVNPVEIKDDENVEFSETARYKVELKYGNDGKKGYISYFIIDKDPIQELTFTSLETNLGEYIKGDKLVSSYTDKPVMLSWKPKLSGAEVTAEYKYFPTEYSVSFANTLTSYELGSLYNSNNSEHKYSIPSTHVFTYNGGQIPLDEYENTYSKEKILDADVLSAGGLYIFKISDISGNEPQFISVFIDKTPNSIMTYDGATYKLATDNETTTTQLEVLFGKTKLIKICATSDISDDWLNIYLANAKCTEYKNQTYLQVDVNSKVYYTVDSETVKAETLSNKSGTKGYGIELKPIDSEPQYIFYTICESTTSAQDSIDFYKQNYTATHVVEYTTDNSRMKVYYTNNETVHFLTKLPTVTVGGTKTNYYYQPTSDIDVLKLNYLVNPSPTIEVKSIKLEYYAFVKDETYGTYRFDTNSTSTVTLYEDGVLLYGEENGDGTYSYNLNTEIFDSKSRTKAGKYVITREYTDESEAMANDPKTRKIVFVVDRYKIIEEPTIDANGNSTYYVGSGIQLQILGGFGKEYYENDESKNLHYYDIYFASKLSQTSLAPVLTTNFLPVTVYIPNYKFGCVVKDNEKGYPKFEPSKTIGEYNKTDGTSGLYPNLTLSAVIKHYKSSSTNKYTEYNLNTALEGYNFLTTKGNNTLPVFKEAGYYEVIIKSSGGDQFRFVFCIELKSPNFDILDSGNTSVVQGHDDSYYTSQKNLRLYWQDSSSKYLATINRETITININGRAYLLDTSVNKPIEAGDNKWYLDIDLSNIKVKELEDGINAFSHGAYVEVTMQYNGNANNYEKVEYFAKTKKIIIDLEAPKENISRLIGLTGISANDLRENADGARFNYSKQSGNFKHFAFTVDKETFKSIILTQAQTNYDYYKVYYRFYNKDKYTGSVKDYETNIVNLGFEGQTDGTIGGQFSDKTFEKDILIEENYNSYIEFIEEDYAGNRTVYTIFLSDFLHDQDQTAFTYRRLSQSAISGGNVKSPVKVSELKNHLDLYSKRSFNLESIDLYNNLSDLLYWQIVNVGDNIFVKTPYKTTYFKYNSNDQTEYTLETLSLLEPSASSQKITINMIPLYNAENALQSNIEINVFVLNKTLEYYTLSQTQNVAINDKEREGILVKLPEQSASENNILYAKKIVIEGTMGGGVSSTFEGNYLRTEQENLQAPTNFKLSYVEYKSAKYLQIEIEGYISANDYFVYTIEDNFGETYQVVHIYGQTEIKQPIIGEGYIAQSYSEDGSIVYYSSENMEYKFDTTIYEKVNISIITSRIVVNPINYVIKQQEGKKEYAVYYEGGSSPIDESVYSEYFTIAMNDNVLSIKMIQPSIDFASGNYGGFRTFALKLNAKEVFKIDPLVMNFEIYNQVPTSLKLLSKESGIDVSSILNGKTAYAGSIAINYSEIKLEHDYEILIEYPDGRLEAIVDGLLIEEDGIYNIVVNYLGEINGCSKTFNFTIASSDKNAYSVAVKQADGTYKTVNATGSSFTYLDRNIYKTITTHYIVNDEFKIVLNSNLYLKDTILKTPLDVDGYTYIYEISNIRTNEAQSGLISEYYSTQIAVTVIPKTNKILTNLMYTGVNVKEDTSDLINIATPIITPYATNIHEYEAGVKIAWSKYNIIPENKVNVEIYYGDIDGVKLKNLKIETVNNLNSISLSISGTYYIKFVDIAGNHQLFGAYSDNEYFTIRYLSNVIFEIEGQTPINHAIYDKPITVSILESTLSYYDVNSKPRINVKLNGEEYTDYKKEGDYSWIFSEPGLYTVYFSAKIDEKAIYEAPIYFTILSSKESRLSFKYDGHTNYYIEDIKLNGESKNELLANVNSGEIVEVDGQPYLKSISLHANDIKTGTGIWTFVINTNNEFNQKFEFSIWINKPTIPIVLSIANGSSTNDTITIRFNTKDLIDEAGDCVLKITGYNGMYITSEKLESGELSENYVLSLTEKGEYYVEIETLSGQLLYSSYVIKTEPLNTISIVIIVVVSLVVIAGTILFIILRRKMKVR